MKSAASVAFAVFVATALVPTAATFPYRSESDDGVRHPSGLDGDAPFEAGLDDGTPVGNPNPDVAILPVLCARPSALGSGLNLDPAATGTILDLPELGIRDVAPVGEDIQSSYFRTTATNREFRRGFMEFGIPWLEDVPVRATLVFAEGPGAIVPNAPPVHSELSWYPADLEVTVKDYDRPTAFLAGFQDDMQDANNVWSFDVTEAVQASQGGCLGFRVKLVLDPDHAGYGGLGTSIGRYSWITPHIELAFD